MNGRMSTLRAQRLNKRRIYSRMDRRMVDGRTVEVQAFTQKDRTAPASFGFRAALSFVLDLK